MGEHDAVVTGSEGLAHMPLTFEEFFELERTRLFRALVLVTRDSALAEELVQEAFVRVWERWERVASMDDPRAYLYRTAMNLHRSGVRRAMTAAKRRMAPLASPPDPFDEIAARDEALRFLGLLTPRQRAAVVATELLGFSSGEAGAILGVRPGTVRTLTAQARATLLAHKEHEHA